MDYLVPGLLGFLVGAVIFGLTYQQVFTPISRLANLGSVTLGQLFDVNPWLVILLFVQMSGILFFVLEKKKL